MKINPFDLTDKAPWQIILRGAAIPGAIIAVCALVGTAMGLFGDGSVKALAKIGIGTGLFFSLWGGLELMAGITFSAEARRKGIYLGIGYFIVWAICLGFIFI